MRAFECDVHTHTLFSRHAYSTIEENVRAAGKAGIKLLGSADHYSPMLFEQQTIRNFQFFINVEAWPRELDGVRLLRGCEADIVNLNGDLFGWDIQTGPTIAPDGSKPKRTLQDLVFPHLDYVVASVHGKRFTCDATLAQTTQMYIKAMEKPKVLVVGHPGRAGVPFDIREMVRAARDLHKLIEINEHSLDESNYDRSHDVCRDIAEACAEEGTSIAVDSDAHFSRAIGRFGNVRNLLDEVHFPEELVATRTPEAFLDAMHAAGLGRGLK